MNHEISISYADLIGIIGILVILLGAFISGWVWVNVQFSRIKVQVADIYKRLDDSDKRSDDIEDKTESSNALLSRELSNSVSRIFNKLDEVVKITTDIRIKCAAHDAVDKIQKH